MDVLREREVKDSLERQLQDEQKVRGEYKSTRFLPGLEIAREEVCPSAKHRIETDGRLTRVYKWRTSPSPHRTRPRTYSFEKIDLAGKQRIDGGRERAIRDTR